MIELLYCPAGHGVHPVIMTYVPGGQENCGWHALIPRSVVVVPGAHCKHLVLLYPGAYSPRAHSWNSELLDVLVNVPGGVLTHAVLLVEPLLGLYEPGLHGMHAALLADPALGL